VIAETRSRHPSAGDIARVRIPAAAASIHERQAGRRRGRGIWFSGGYFAPRPRRPSRRPRVHDDAGLAVARAEAFRSPVSARRSRSPNGCRRGVGVFSRRAPGFRGFDRGGEL